MVSVLGLTALVANGGTMGGEDIQPLPNLANVTLTLPKFNGNIAHLKKVYVELELRFDNARIQMDNDSDTDQTGTGRVHNELDYVTSSVTLMDTDSYPFEWSSLGFVQKKEFTLGPTTGDSTNAFNAQPYHVDYANWEPGLLKKRVKGDINSDVWSEFVGSGTFEINVKTEYYVSTSVTGGNVHFEGQTPSGQVYAKVRYDFDSCNLGDSVWEDTNGNGIQDASELGLTNVTVGLHGSTSNLLATTVTDIGGKYAFTNLFPGTYFVQAVSPAGYINTLAFAEGNTAIDSDGDDFGWSGPVTMVSGETNNSIDFGFNVPANIHGYLFKDKDGSLTRNKDDTTITNALVTLIVGGNTIGSTHTDTNGYYYFADVPPGAVTVQTVQNGATLIGRPAQDPGLTDPTRNRAVTNAVDTAVIEYTVLSGQGVLTGVLYEPLNFGYSVHPLSTALDIKVYADANGKVMIEISTANENGNHPIEVYAKIDGEWVLVATIPADQIIGFGSNTYIVEAFGLTPGESYEFKIVDESGHIFESGSIQVARSLVAVETMTLTPNLITISFKTTPGLRYQVMVCESLGAPWRVEYVQSPTKKGWSALNNELFNAGPDGETQVLVPCNNRAKAFFKILQVD